MKKQNPKFKIGDKVKVIQYGHIIFSINKPKKFPIVYQDDNFYYFDISPNIIGKTGVVNYITSQNKYALDGIPDKSSWYDEKQLELIE